MTIERFEKLRNVNVPNAFLHYLALKSTRVNQINFTENYWSAILVMHNAKITRVPRSLLLPNKALITIEFNMFRVFSQLIALENTHFGLDKHRKFRRIRQITRVRTRDE